MVDKRSSYQHPKFSGILSNDVSYFNQYVIYQKTYLLLILHKYIGNLTGHLLKGAPVEGVLFPPFKTGFI